VGSNLYPGTAHTGAVRSLSTLPTNSAGAGTLGNECPYLLALAKVSPKRVAALHIIPERRVLKSDGKLRTLK
jgi:hypothetical protein